MSWSRRTALTFRKEAVEATEPTTIRCLCTKVSPMLQVEAAHCPTSGSAVAVQMDTR